MKKRISLWLTLTVLTVALAAVLVACSSAEKKASEGLAFVSNGDGTCFVSGIGTCTDKNVRIPSVSPDGDSVTSIGAHAFEGCTKLTIPDSVTSISFYAFSGYTSLTSIQVDENNPVYHSDGNCLIETATKTLVLGCKTSIIPTDGSVISIGKSAFFSCTSLTNITIPDNVISIGSKAFCGCTGLTSITIPDSVTVIGESAFAGCTGLTSITISDSVTSIGDRAFSSCYSLTNILVGEHNTAYHSEGNCLIETASKTLIVGCKTSTIPIDGSVTSIGKFAFFNCTSLTNITIPNSVTCIGDDAFRQCFSLTNITIPDSVNSIGYQAFSYCWHLTSITFYGTKAQWQAIEKGSRWTFDSRINTIHCTDGDIQI